MAGKERLFGAMFGINNYVPKMQYSGHLVHEGLNEFSLGSPAAVSANSIAASVNAQAAANTVATLTTPFQLDGTYGRTLRLTPSGNPGNSAAIIVRGRDYLGQPMTEKFTGASGSTAILYGKKAFKWVVDTIIDTQSTNAVTWAVGTGWRLGLPYKGDVAWAKENGVMVPLYKRDVEMWADRSAVLAAAGGSKWIRSPFPGFVSTLIGTPDGGGGATDPVITVELGNAAIVGLTVTVDTSDTNGTTVTDLPTTIGYNANNRLRTADFVEIVGAAASGAFGDRVGVILTPTQVTLPDTTDPATNTTGDPRGTYEPLLTPNGSEIIVAMSVDRSFNAAGNGGLHGIRQV